MKTLTRDQIEQFVEEGYTYLRGGFAPQVAQRLVDRVWREIGLSPDRPEQWTKRHVHLQKRLEGPELAEIYNPRVRGALDDLMGEGRWVERTSTGWWPVVFPGFDAPPWQPPAKGWHIDGIHFHHRLRAPDQGLLIIMIFSAIGPGDGGTVFRPGSHKVTARVLADAEPEGLEVGELSQRVNAHVFPEVIESNGQPGDMVLLHPFMSHAGSANAGSRVRFITNNCIELKAPMDLDRPNSADYSPVERAIVEALVHSGR